MTRPSVLNYRIRRCNKGFGRKKTLLAGLAAIIGPFQIDGAPGKSSAESRKNNGISFFEQLFIIPEQKRNGASRSIAIALDVHHDFFSAYTHARGSGVDDALI